MRLDEDWGAEMTKRSVVLLAGLLGWVWLSVSTTWAETPASFRERINRGTVGIISGGVAGTYVRVASDLANVLDKGDDLRVLAVLGKGSVQNIDDLLYLRGIDIAIHRKVLGPGLDSHDYFFQAGVAGPLADAVDGDFYLPGAVVHAGQGIGRSQS